MEGCVAFEGASRMKNGRCSYRILCYKGSQLYETVGWARVESRGVATCMVLCIDKAHENILGKFVQSGGYK